MKINLGALFRRANTHAVANSGLAVTAAAGAIHIAADLISKGAIHAPLAAQIAVTDLDTLTAPLATGGTIAAYFGRPKTIPTSPVVADVPRPSQRIAAALPIVAGQTGGRSPSMATTFEGKIADGIVAFYENNEGALSALLVSKNVPAATFVETATLALLAKSPMLQMVLQGEVKALAPQIVTFLGGEEAAGLAALDALLRAEATKLGG